VRLTTPETQVDDMQDEEMKERISSPKKKRGRDQDEDVQEAADEKAEEGSDGSAANGRRLTTSEPEKKRRPRDMSEDYTKAIEKSAEAKEPPSAKTTISTTETETKIADLKSQSTKGNDKPQTLKSAFASSGFASLANSTTSPFGSIAADKPSIFGGGSSTISGFGALAAAKPSTNTSTTTSTSGFGVLAGDKPPSGFAFGGGASAFGGLPTGIAFGSKLGNGFGGGSGPKLSTFAAPTVESTLAVKPAKPFGAPESGDEESDSDSDDSDGPDEVGDEETATDSPEEKKKTRLTKVHIDDGESGEATLLQVRAKLFAVESKGTGWKERGVGNLKINVPKPCVSYDMSGLPIRGSFDASGLEEDEEEEPSSARVVRLIMRQENTHRVVLNTVIVRAMEFKDKPAASTAQIMFTAFEGSELKPINMLLKMSEANARLFKSEIDSIQREL